MPVIAGFVTRSKGNAHKYRFPYGLAANSSKGDQNPSDGCGEADKRHCPAGPKGPLVSCRPCSCFWPDATERRSDFKAGSTVAVKQLSTLFDKMFE
jgi:hypothetical protein